MLLFLVAKALSSECIDATVAPNYNESAFISRWYEVAKIQTAGGAFFEKGCTCTTSSISRQPSKIDIQQTCVKNGKAVNIDGQLVPDQSKAGRFKEIIGFNTVGYWVLHQDEDSVVTYDCHKGVLGVDYCLHFMSKGRTMDSAKLKYLVELAQYLNTEKLPLQVTNQTSCPSQLQ